MSGLVFDIDLMIGNMARVNDLSSFRGATSRSMISIGALRVGL